MPDWLTIILSITLSTSSSLVATHLIHEKVWRARVSRILGSLRTYRDLRRATEKLGRKPRRRYIVFEIVSKEKLSQDDLDRALKSIVREYLGITGLASSGASLVYFDEARGRGVIRVNNEYRYQILGLLGLLRRVGNSKVLVIPLAVTGTIKRAKRLIG